MARNRSFANGRRGHVRGSGGQMTRFTIRELALMTVIVAIGVGWWVDRQRTAAMHTAALEKSNIRAAFLLRTLEEHKIVVEELKGGYVAYPQPAPKPTDRYTP